MQYLLFSMPLIISILFYLSAQAAFKRRMNRSKHKIPNWVTQILLKVTAIAISIGIYYLFVYLREISFIAPHNGYDITQGINMFSAIAIVVIMVCFVVCFDTIFSTYNATNKDSINLFHWRSQVKPANITLIIFISSYILLFGVLNFTYFNQDGTFVINENMGYSSKQYTQNDIESVNLNTYEGRGNTFTDLIITFSDTYVITTSADSKGAKLFLLQWQGQIVKTNNQP